jgi:hypothetical protein
MHLHRAELKRPTEIISDEYISARAMVLAAIELKDEVHAADRALGVD